MGNCLPKSHPHRDGVADKAASRGGSGTRSHDARDGAPDGETTTSEVLDKRKGKDVRRMNAESKAKIISPEKAAVRGRGRGSQGRSRTTSPKQASLISRHKDQGPVRSEDRQPSKHARQALDKTSASSPTLLVRDTSGAVLRASEEVKPQHPLCAGSDPSGSSAADNYRKEASFLNLLQPPERSGPPVKGSPSTRHSPHRNFSAEMDSISEGYYGSANNYQSATSDRGYGIASGGYPDSPNEYISDHDFERKLKHTIGMKDGGAMYIAHSRASLARRRELLERYANEPPQPDEHKDNYYSNDRLRMIKARQRQRNSNAEKHGGNGGAPATRARSLLEAAPTHAEKPLRSLVSHPALERSIGQKLPSVAAATAAGSDGHPHRMTAGLSGTPLSVPVRLPPRLQSGASSRTTADEARGGKQGADASPVQRTPMGTERHTDGEEAAAPPPSNRSDGFDDLVLVVDTNSFVLRPDNDEDDDEGEDDAVDVAAADPEFEFDVNMSFRRCSPSTDLVGDDTDGDLMGYYGDANDDSVEDAMLQEHWAALGYKPNDTNNDECYQEDQHHVNPYGVGDTDEHRDRQLARREQQNTSDDEPRGREDTEGCGKENGVERDIGYVRAPFAASFPGSGHCHAYNVDDFAHPLPSVATSVYVYGEDVSAAVAAREAQQAAAAARERQEARRRVGGPGQPTKHPDVGEQRTGSTPNHRDPVDQPNGGTPVESPHRVGAAIATTVDVADPRRDSASLTVLQETSINSTLSVATQRHQPTRRQVTLSDSSAIAPDPLTRQDSRADSVDTVAAPQLSRANRQPQPQQRRWQDEGRPQAPPMEHARSASVPSSEVTVATIPAEVIPAPTTTSRSPQRQRQQQQQRGGRHRAREEGTARVRQRRDGTTATATPAANGEATDPREAAALAALLRARSRPVANSAAARAVAHTGAGPPRPAQQDGKRTGRNSRDDRRLFSASFSSPTFARRSSTATSRARSGGKHAKSQSGRSREAQTAGGGRRGGNEVQRNTRGRTNHYRNSAEYRNGGGMFFLSTYTGDSGRGGGDGGGGDHGSGDGGGGDFMSAMM